MKSELKYELLDEDITKTYHKEFDLTAKPTRPRPVVEWLENAVDEGMEWFVTISSIVVLCVMIGGPLYIVGLFIRNVVMM